MRLIQFNSGLYVILKDVQQDQTEHPQEYYLTTPTSAHYSSNSSIATTSSSIKSNGSTGVNNGHYVHRQIPAPSYSITQHQYNRVITSSAVTATPSTVIVEVGISISMMSKSVVCVCVCVCVIFVQKIDTYLNV
jgi:hypothetical protein